MWAVSYKLSKSIILKVVPVIYTQEVCFFNVITVGEITTNHYFSLYQSYYSHTPNLKLNYIVTYRPSIWIGGLW